MLYCDRCKRQFSDYRALEQHKKDSGSHWFCDDCGLDFASSDTRRDHYIQSENHHYCWVCNRDFNSEASRKQHMDARHWYCVVHDQVFQNQNNLQQHLNSKRHQPSNTKCPGQGCNRSFPSAAALILHFESGTCPSGITRAELDRQVVRADRNNFITNPDRLICGPGGYEPPTTSSWATELSWNGLIMKYECFLCHNTFNTLHGLNQHLQSPFHNKKIYRCPKPDCRIEFKTLSALWQHVERGSCGVRRFKQVCDVMDDLTRSVNAITL